MASYQEPNFSYTETTLRREVHTDVSHWELMYKAMLAQLMTCVDAAVARALAERGLDGSAAGRDAPQASADRPRQRAAGPAPEPAPHPCDPPMSGPLAGVALPPWLQPFTLPEQVRFTRTPDSLLRTERTPPHESEPPRVGSAAEPEAIEADLPAWKKPVELPSNVRFNRTPYPRPSGQDGAADAPAAEIPGSPGADRIVIALADVQADRALAAAALSVVDEAGPSWLAIVRAEPASTPHAADEQDNAGLFAGQSASDDDDLAAAWLRAHEAVMAARASRMTPEPSASGVPEAFGTMAPDPDACSSPYGDIGLRGGVAAPPAIEAPTPHENPASSELEADVPPASAVERPDLHVYGEAAFRSEGLADPLPSAPIGVADAPALFCAEVAPEGPALPALKWLSVGAQPVLAPAAPVPEPLEPPLAETATWAFGPYGDPRLWTLESMPEPDAPRPYGDPNLWFAAAPEPGSEAVAPVPIGIASPDDARAFAAPAKSGPRRALGRSHGRAPSETTSRVTAGPELYEDPPLDLLMPPPEPTGEVLSSGALEQNARLLEGVLEEFGVRGEIIDVRPGPVVTLYELEPAPGTKSSRVIGLADDIARSMSAVSARVAVVQGRNVIGIELPNQRRETVFLRELVGSGDFLETKHKLAIALGKSIGGESIIVDLARMPHLLVAGTTGSGKSVAINTMILSILYRLKPEECRLIMIDPKMLELSIYEGIPHLLTPVVTDPKKAVVALKWAVREMEDRYKKMSKVGVRNIDGFNARVTEAAHRGEVITRTVQTGFNRETGEPIFETEEMELSPLPYIVVIVDEMADLMMVAGKDIEGAIQRLAQMARAAGIHLIMATQRPSVDVITGTIKANFPTRISFQVTSKIDSRTILSEQGAEQLLGQGDMLYMAGGGRISRVHGPFVSDGEVESVVAHLKRQGHPAYLDVVVAEDGGDDAKADAPEERPVFERSATGTAEDDNELYDQAVKVVLRDKKCSTSYIQRRLQVGYNKAASLVERMEKEGIVGQANNAGKREILVYSRDLRYTEGRDEE